MPGSNDLREDTILLHILHYYKCEARPNKEDLVLLLMGASIDLRTIHTGCPKKQCLMRDQKDQGEIELMRGPMLMQRCGIIMMYDLCGVMLDDVNPL